MWCSYVLRDIGTVAHREQIDGAGQMFDAAGSQCNQLGVEPVDRLRADDSSQRVDRHESGFQIATTGNRQDVGPAELEDHAIAVIEDRREHPSLA